MSLGRRGTEAGCLCHVAATGPADGIQSRSGSRWTLLDGRSVGVLAKALGCSLCLNMGLVAAHRRPTASGCINSPAVRGAPVVDARAFGAAFTAFHAPSSRFGRGCGAFELSWTGFDPSCVGLQRMTMRFRPVLQGIWSSLGRIRTGSQVLRRGRSSIPSDCNRLRPVLHAFQRVVNGLLPVSIACWRSVAVRFPGVKDPSRRPWIPHRSPMALQPPDLCSTGASTSGGSHPSGVVRGRVLVSRGIGNAMRLAPLPGSGEPWGLVSGGVAALDHRLRADIPSGCDGGRARVQGGSEGHSSDTPMLRGPCRPTSTDGGRRAGIHNP